MPIRARKRFGQHWLRSDRILDNIIAAADLSSRDRVLEIGPGTGALTRRLLSVAGRVVAVELDWDVHRRLAKAPASATTALAASRLPGFRFGSDIGAGCALTQQGRREYSLQHHGTDFAQVAGNYFPASIRKLRLNCLIGAERSCRSPLRPARYESLWGADSTLSSHGHLRSHLSGAPKSFFTTTEGRVCRHSPAAAPLSRAGIRPQAFGGPDPIGICQQAQDAPK